jgi:hypothetical protein
MKKIFLLLALTIVAQMSGQAITADEVALFQEVYGKSKAELVKQYMNLPDAQDDKFQVVYNSYEAERKVLGQKKIEIINDYAKNYDILSDSKADELVKANFKNNLDVEKLIAKTYDKVKKAIGVINAAKFAQLEEYLQITIRSEIQDSIPFIDELDKTKKN